MKMLHTMYSYLASKPSVYVSAYMADDIQIQELRKNWAVYAKVLSAGLCGRWPRAICMLKGFGDILDWEVTDHKEQAYRVASQRWIWSLVEAVGDLETRKEEDLKRIDSIHNGDLSLQAVIWRHTERTRL